MGIRGNWDKRRVEEFGRLGEIDRRTFVKLGGAGTAALVLGLGPFEERAVARPRFTSNPFSPTRSSPASGSAWSPRWPQERCSPR